MATTRVPAIEGWFTMPPADADFPADGSGLPGIRLLGNTSRLLADLALPAGVLASEPGDALARVDRLSRAYRVNLTVLALVALAGAHGQYFMVLAFAKAPASALSPYLYSAIGFSALGGWWMFGHLPDALDFVGMAMIAGFGLVAGWSRTRGHP